MARHKKEEKVEITSNDGKIDITKLLEVTKKSFPEALVTTGDDPELAVKTIPSGIWLLDNALKGGFRRGCLNEITGEYSTGKTWLILHTIKQAQSLGYTCGLIDTEKRFDPEWSKNKLGIELKDILIVKNIKGTPAFQLMLKWIDAGIDLIGVDSISHLIPDDFANSDEFNATMGVKARLMSDGLDRLIYRNRKTCVLAANQLRADIGSRFNRGIMKKMTGGAAQYFDAASIIEIRRRAWLNELGESGGEDEDKESKKHVKIGFVMDCLISKVNYAPSVQTVVKINYNFRTSEVDNILSVVEMAKEKGIIKAAGPYFKWEEEGVSELGSQAIRDFFQNNPKKFEKLKETVMPRW